VSTSADKLPVLAELQRELRLMNATSAFFSQAIAERLGMSSHELETMDLLNLHGPLSPGQIAELTGLSSGGVTRLLDRLERDDFVRRLPDPADRRRLRVELVARTVATRAAPLFVSMARGHNALAERYTVEQLEVIIDFVRASREVTLGELDRLRQREILHSEESV
jgi:DNA-binding MarR family transcriptional regulator